MIMFDNFKEWFKRVKPYFILLFIPILFTLLFGEAMSPIFVEDIPIGIYDMDNSPSSKDVIDQFYDCPVFDIEKNYDDMKKLEEDLMMSRIRGAVVIPKEFGEDLKGKKGAEALVLIDSTNIVIGNNLKAFAVTVFSTINAGIQLKTLEAGEMVPYQAEQNIYTLSVVDRTLYNPQVGYLYYLYAGFLAILIQQSFLSVTPSILLMEKSRLKKLPEDPRVKKVQVARMSRVIGMYAVVSMISMLACLLIVNKLYSYPLYGSLWLTLLLHVIFIACLVGVSLVIAAIFDDVTHCAQFTMFLTIPTLLSCGYSWPEYMMAKGFAPAMKALWPLYYYSNPLKDIMLKGVDFEVIGHYVIGSIIFAAVWIPVGLLFYNHKLKIIRQIERKI
ncbi:ABC transporter permease [Anaerovorax odorimutans]|uniref:ABC transporter permease n=1 Tax=Anaerovorax odorimutans TaxID=109327 RepID=UPI00041C82C0|nr:ABC transporter permease [Anaerovorax odorimutans]